MFGLIDVHRAVARRILCPYCHRLQAIPLQSEGFSIGCRNCHRVFRVTETGSVAVEPEQTDRRAAETLLGRVGSPEDVAEAVSFLAGADFVTGTTLVVDGGRLLQSARGKKP